MRRNVMFTLIIVSMIALATGWYFLSPIYTLGQMRSAAEAGDSDAMAAYIDFPSLREDMKAEIIAQLRAEAEKDSSALGSLGFAFGGAMVGPMVDGLITPAGLRAAFIARRNEAQGPSRSAPAAMQVGEEPTIERRGMSEFLVRAKADKAGGMVFKRDGLGWRLSGIDLPPPASVVAGTQP